MAKLLLLAAVALAASLLRGERTLQLRIAPDAEFEHDVDIRANCLVSETDTDQLRWTGDLSTVSRDAQLTQVTLPKTLHTFANDCLANAKPELFSWSRLPDFRLRWRGSFSFSVCRSWPRPRTADGATAGRTVLLVRDICREAEDYELVWDLLHNPLEEHIVEALLLSVDIVEEPHWTQQQYYAQWNFWTQKRIVRLRTDIEQLLGKAGRSSFAVDVRMDALDQLARLERFLTAVVDERISRKLMALVNIPRRGYYWQWFVDLSVYERVRILRGSGGDDVAAGVVVPVEFPSDWGEGDRKGLALLRYLQAFLWRRLVKVENPFGNENIWTKTLGFLHSSGIGRFSVVLA